jgi:ferredoxin
MHVIIDTDKCIASGSCVITAPAVFDQRDDDGIVVLLAERPAPEHADAVRSAAHKCPTLAITVSE